MPTAALPTNIYPGAALIATGLAAHGLRKGSLSQSGAVAAWIVGYATLANPLKLFGSNLIVFYLVGSRATRVKAALKARLEDGPDPSKPGGNRDAVQVLSNSLPSLVAALVFRYYCVGAPSPLLDAGLPRRLIFATVGHFATCLGDTLASELGILSPSRPIHLLTLQRVPPGTNGAVSLRGLLASAVGGAIMGLAAVADLAVEEPVVDPQGAAEVLVWGTVAGFVGSLLDSLLGATLQRTLYKDGRVLTEHSDVDRQVGATPIGPGRDVLSNSGVNFVCACVMAGVGYWVGGWGAGV